MKTPVAVALIIVGGILILAPATADYLARAQVAAVLLGRNIPDVNLPASMSSLYRFGCCISGGVMIAAAVFMSRNSKPQV
jgi:hypothetical protein